MRNPFKRKNRGFYFLTVRIGNVAYDYPASMPIPRKGETVFFGAVDGIVTDVFYSVLGSDCNMVTIFAETEKL